nr:hypothetical protein [Tanacetum cinerariifolium]
EGDFVLSKLFGVTTARLLRKQFKADDKLVKSAKAQHLSGLQQWHSLARVVLPGKVNGTYLVEMKLSQLSALIDAQRQHGAETTERKLKAKLSKKNQQAKELKQRILAKDEEISSLDDQLSDSESSVAKAKRDLISKT